MKPEDLSFLDQLEEWLEAQVPKDLGGLPHRMLETMERMSNEIFETLNINGPSSISIPFPPFGVKEPPPPPPPPPAMSAFPVTLYNRAEKLARAHPYVLGTGAALALTVGMGYTGAHLGYGGKWGKAVRDRRKFGTNGVIEDGMLKEAIVVLSPSPMPPMLWVLTVTLLKAGYVVLVAVPHVEDAEALEKRLAPLDEKSGLRVLIYDPEDSTTFPPFHRSLLATLTLRFPAPNAQAAGDPYNPQASHVPHIHAFISLYPLHPAPPSQPNALPALPTLLSPDHNGRTPMLVTLYPSGSVLVQPDSFASQILTANHRLLGKNLAAFSSSRIVSVYVGHLNLPPLHQIINNVRLFIHRLTFTERWRICSTYEKIFVVKDAVVSALSGLYSGVAGRLGLGPSAKDYKHFERKILRILKTNHGTKFSVGQYPRLPFLLSHVSPWILAPLLRVLPNLPDATGPLNASVQGLPAPRKPLSSAASATTSTSARKSGNAATDSASSSDHESGEDLASSLHSLHSTRSGVTASSRGESSGSGAAMEDSWAHLDASS